MLLPTVGAFKGGFLERRFRRKITDDQKISTSSFEYDAGKTAFGTEIIESCSGTIASI